MAPADTAAHSQGQQPQQPVSNPLPSNSQPQKDFEEQEEASLSALSAAAQLDLGVSLILSSWPALTLAVQSSWGGPTSVEKRDWFCGAIADLFSDRPDTDALDLEEVLLQVMNDEFDVVVDDGSAAEIAGKIIEIRAEIGKGQLDRLGRLWEEWKTRKGGREARDMFKRVETGEEDQDTDGDEEEWVDDEDDDEEDGDVVMEDVSRQPRERTEPEVDEDGFTKVVGKKKR